MPDQTRPTSVRIGPIDWAINYSSSDLAQLDKEYETEPRLGCCDTRTCRIYIDGDTMTDSAVKETLLHEILHATFFTAGLRSHLDTRKVDRDIIEERLVGSLSPSLLDTLQRNPGLAAYLTG